MIFKVHFWVACAFISDANPPSSILQDTADAAGDFFFDLHNVYLMPLMCPNGAASGSHCTNPEATSPNLVVNKLVLTVDTRYSGYVR